MSTQKRHATTPPPSRAELAAEAGIGERTLLRNLARSRAELALAMKRHAARGVILASECNRLVQLSRSQEEQTRLRANAKTLAGVYVALFGEGDQP